MPTYEYECKECGIIFERFQHFSEEPIKTCPECNGAVHRLIHPVGIIFKGSGFYVTDNKSGASSLMPKSEKTEAKKEAGHTAEPAKKEAAPAKNEGEKKD